MQPKIQIINLEIPSDEFFPSPEIAAAARESSESHVESPSSDDPIDITGLSKAQVLKALHDAAKPLGMGFLQSVQGEMSMDEANDWVAASPRLYFDYVLGRPLKVSLAEDSFSAMLYDRDQGTGQAARAIAALRESLS